MNSLPLFDLPSSWTPPREPPNLDNVELMAIDTETYDPRLLTHGPGFTRGESRPVGASIATEDSSWYFPFDHPGDNCEWDVKRWLQETFAVNRRYIFCNAMYDVGALSIIDAIPQGEWADICIIQAMLNEQFQPGYSLDAMSRYWLGSGKDETLLNQALATYGFNDKGGISFLPARYVGQYADIDAMRTMQTYVCQWPHIEAEDLVGVLDLEEAILPIIWRMMKRGINLDWDRAAYLHDKWDKERKELFTNVSKMAGMAIDPGSSKSIARYCHASGITYRMTDKGNPSFTADWLAEATDPVLSAIARMRKIVKMMGFIESWHEYRGKDGRVHPQWLTTMAEEGGTRSGRFASCDPNLQQVPIRDPEFGPEMRALWLPEPGMLWGKTDVQSQEIRIAVHYAFLMKCEGAVEMVEAYLKNPRLDFHQRVADIAGVDRNSAKTISLGSLYGMGQNKLAGRLGFSYDHAMSVYSQYHAAVPFVQDLSEKVSKVAIERGYVKTYLGRRRHFPNGENAHKALNSVVQGTAADQMKTMILNVEAELGVFPMVTVHDELGFSVESEEQLKEIAGIMENALEFKVPMVVDYSVSNTWNQK
jgi:DNA polymerase-1